MDIFSIPQLDEKKEVNSFSYVQGGSMKSLFLASISGIKEFSVTRLVCMWDSPNTQGLPPLSGYLTKIKI